MDAQASLIAAVPVDFIQEKRPIQYFNERTGVPYFKEETHTHHKIQGTDIPIPEDLPDGLSLLGDDEDPPAQLYLGATIAATGEIRRREFSAPVDDAREKEVLETVSKLLLLHFDYSQGARRFVLCEAWA